MNTNLVFDITFSSMQMQSERQKKSIFKEKTIMRFDLVSKRVYKLNPSFECKQLCLKLLLFDSSSVSFGEYKELVGKAAHEFEGRKN